MRKIAILAQAFGRQFIPHCALADLGTIAALHLVAAFPHSAWLEIIHDPPICSYRDRFAVLRDPPLVKDGKITLPQRPGLGVEVNPDLIERS